MKKRIVLFVDDEKNVLLGLERMFHPMRGEWEMLFAESGEVALNVMNARRVDAVVSDMQMPGMSGCDLLAEISRKWPDTVRIILSGHTKKEYYYRSFSVAHRILAKPCTPGLLKNAVEKACATRKTLNRPSLRKLVSRLSSLPSLPPLYRELVSELESADGSLDRIGRIVSKDVSMTAQILHVVNSALFGLSGHVDNPVQAVSLLGIDSLKGLVLTVGIFSQFTQKQRRLFELDKLWAHSMTVGVFIRRILKMENYDPGPSDDSITIGLLHDVGKAVLIGNIPDYKRVIEAAEEKRVPVFKMENERFGATHAEIGAFLLGLWGMPDQILEAIAFHYRPNECPNAEFGFLTALHVADFLEHELVEPNGTTCVLDTDYLVKVGVLEKLSGWRKACKALLGKNGA